MMMRALRVDVSGFLVHTVEAYLNAVLTHCDTDTNKQLLLSQLCHAHVLVDKDSQTARWRQTLTNYPDALADAMVRTHLVPHPRWPQRHALYERDDALCVHELATATLKSLTFALCAANRVYISDPNAKWWAMTVDGLSICPDDLHRRGSLVLRGHGLAALTELQALVTETCERISRLLPNSAAKQALALFMEDSRPALTSTEIDAMSLELVEPRRHEEPTTEETSIRPATPNDVDAIASLFARVRAQMTYLPRLYSNDEQRSYFHSQLNEHQGLVAVSGSRLLGFAIFGNGWLHHLYVDVAHQNAGVGSALLSLALSRCTPIQLWTFQHNHGARRFYERHGLVAVEMTDGVNNAEKLPDVRYALSLTV